MWSGDVCLVSGDVCLLSVILHSLLSNPLFSLSPLSRFYIFPCLLISFLVFFFFQTAFSVSTLTVQSFKSIPFILSLDRKHIIHSHLTLTHTFPRSLSIQLPSSPLSFLHPLVCAFFFFSFFCISLHISSCQTDGVPLPQLPILCLTLLSLVFFWPLFLSF